MILQFHPISNMFVKQLALGLARAGMLREFWTGLRWPADEGVLRVLPASLRRTLVRRALPREVEPFARMRPWMEMARLAANAMHLRGLVAHETGRLSVDAVFHDFDKALARRTAHMPGLRAVYGYEDGAEFTFREARARGIGCFYDLPIGYWRTARRLLTEEAELSPEWAGTMHGNRDSAAKLARKDAEVALADLVVVASSFTRSTLAEHPEFKGDVVTVPYGAPPSAPGARPASRKPGEPLRVLFVGSLGQRKGVRYLLEAVEAASPGVELTLIGAPPSAECAPLRRALDRHRHIASAPHRDVLAEMQRHHVFVFPSLFEGFGLVVLEAMSQGLPVIATAHTCAPDVIRDGVDGWIVPIRSADAIAAKLRALAEDDDRRQSMGAAAIERARQFSWESYGTGVATALRARIDGHPAQPAHATGK